MLAACEDAARASLAAGVAAEETAPAARGIEVRIILLIQIESGFCSEYLTEWRAAHGDTDFR